MSSVGLYSRKKRDEFGSTDVVKGLEQSPSSGGLDRSHRRRRNPLSRFLRSEVGCALEMVLAFLVVGLLMGYVILGHQKRKVILHIMNDPIGHGAALKGRSGFRHHFYTGHPRSVTVVLPSVVNPEKRPRRLESIAETWGPAARAVFVVHNISEFPSASNAVISSEQTPEDQYSYPQLMLAPASIGPDDGVPRLIWVLRMVHERINPDFALFVNDHTFVVTEHLCKYLEPMNPNDHMYHGHALKNDGLVFNSGAAGYILSRETMKKLVHLFDAGDPLCTGKSANKWLQGNPALLTTQCMKEKLGVVPVDTRNRQSKNGVPQHRFHAFPLTRSVSLDVDQWYINKHEVSRSDDLYFLGQRRQKLIDTSCHYVSTNREWTS